MNAAMFAATETTVASFPVRYSLDGRYLVDHNAMPFPIMGRTAWFVTSLSVADYHTFIDDTSARGYNSIELHVVNHDPRGNNPPFNGNGDLPFLDQLDGASWDGSLSYNNIDNEAPDFTTPNEVYWSFVDGLLSYCETKGILVFFFPAYAGFDASNQGWMQELVANGPVRIESYGNWIATRYRDQKNLVWMMGGDMGTFTVAQNEVESALLIGLKSVTAQQSIYFSAEWSSGMIATDQMAFGGSMTLNGAYSFTGDVNALGRHAYTYSPIEPAFLLEEPYDEEGPDGNGVNQNATQPVRRFQWWGWLSSIGGYISGNGYVWPFRAPDWQQHLETQGSRDMARLNAFIGSIAWYKLVPSGLNGMRTLITAGGGSSVSASDYVAATATLDGTLFVAYIPPDHTGSITVDMAAMSAPVQARWFDPTNAVYSEIGTGLPNTGTRVFTPPGNNSTGQTDWILRMDTLPTSSPTPTASPAISPTSTPFPSPTSTPTSTPGPGAQTINLSTRMTVGTGDTVGIGGFIVNGAAPKQVLLRALGPSLAAVGVPHVLADPILELHGPDPFVTITDDNWRDDPTQEALIAATGIAPTNDLESAIIATLNPGAYTGIVRGIESTSGVSLIEVYDLNPDDSKLGNISTRAFVSTDDNIVIAGFILGQNNGNDRIVVRGIGPSLTAGGVTDTLADPTLELRDGNGTPLIFNNDWQDDNAQADELIAAGLAPADPLEAGIAITLAPGSYTALLAGRAGGTGLGLVEVYDRRNGQ